MKKNIMFGLIAVLFVFALSGIVSAAASLNTPVNITLGSTTSQERNISISTNFNLTNNGDVNVTNLTISSASVDSKYNVMFSWDNSVFSNSINITNLAINDSKIVYVKGIIPLSEAAGTNINIGSISISNITISKTITIYINPSNFVASLNVPSSITIGSSEEERNKTISSSFDVTNSGNVDLSGLFVATNADSKYNVSFSLDNNIFNKNVTISLPAGSTKKVYVIGFIPYTQPSGKNIDIADITLTSALISKTIPYVYINPVSKLEIKSVDFTYGGETNSVSKGSTESFDYKGARDFKIEFDAKNTYSKSDDIDIEDITYDIIIEDIDDSDDMDKEFDDSVLSSGNKERKSVSFTLPADVEDGSFKVRIEASGKDTYNAIQTYNWYGYLKFDKQDHYVKISSVSINPITLKCTRAATVTVNVINIGDEDESHAAVTLNSSTLGVSVGEPFAITSETDSSSSKRTLSFPISIADVQPGKYILGVNAYAANGALWTDYYPLDVNVAACDGTTTTTPATPTTTPTTTSTNNTIIQYITQPAANQGQIIGQPVEETSNDSIATIALLALGALVVMIIIIVLLVKLVK